MEFNARFGDPEAMNTLPVLNTAFIDVLTAARDDDPLPQLSFRPMATVCKYAVPDGYPTDPDAGAKVPIDDDVIAEVVNDHRKQSGDDPETAPEALLCYASVDDREDGIYTTTSRSYAVVGVADSDRRRGGLAEDALAGRPEGFHIRHDIGTAASSSAHRPHGRLRGGAD